MEAIEKLGGKAEIHTEMRRGYMGGMFETSEVIGEVAGYDVEMNGTENHCFTIRRIADRNHCDEGIDYNPGGYIFLYKIKDLGYWLSLDK